MTLEQRLDHVEQQNERILQQNQRIERKNKRLTAALTLMAVAMCAVVTVAATGEKDEEFHTVTARQIGIRNDAGKLVVGLGATDAGDGLVVTRSAMGKELIVLSLDGHSGAIDVFKKTGEIVASIGTQDDGDGQVWIYNRKGKARMLKPGP